MCSSMNDSIDNGLKAFGDLVLPMTEIESAMGHFASGLSSFITSRPVGVRSIAMSVSYVCLSSRISKQHVQTSRNFCTMYMLPVAVARLSYDDNAICYVLPVCGVDGVMFANNGQ